VNTLEANKRHIQKRFTQIRQTVINSKLKILWHIDPLLGNDGETNGRY
jgi:3-deoxy-D-arabino-heptulosonate 7-phosphate (DAHP) synthase class II